MGKVVYDVSMSLDGYIAAANVRPEAGLGDGGERLHEWVFNSSDPRNRQFLEVEGSTYPMDQSIFLLIVSKLLLKRQKKRQVIRILV